MNRRELLWFLFGLVMLVLATATIVAALLIKAGDSPRAFAVLLTSIASVFAFLGGCGLASRLL